MMSPYPGFCPWLRHSGKQISLQVRSDSGRTPVLVPDLRLPLPFATSVIPLRFASELPPSYLVYIL